MPEITILGWFHTILGVLALLFGFYSLGKYKFIKYENFSGKFYLLITLIFEGTSLLIYNQGGFGPAHAMGVLAIGAVFVGIFAEKTQVFRSFSKYIETLSYSSTFLFHLVPATFDGLRRLPTDNPIVKELDDPILLNSILAVFLIYLLLLASQFYILYKK